MNKKIILISIDKWCLKYLNDSFTDKLLAKTTLITNKVSKELKTFAKNKKIKIIQTSKIKKKIFRIWILKVLLFYLLDRLGFSKRKL